MIKLLFSLFFLCLIILIFFLSFHPLKKRFGKAKELKTKKEFEYEVLKEPKEEVKKDEEVIEDEDSVGKSEKAEAIERETEQKLKTSIDRGELDGVRDELEETKVEEPEIKKESKKREVSPEVRGGRPRKIDKYFEKKRVKKPKSKQPKIDIVCWKEGFTWVMGAEVEDSPEGLHLYQNGKPLEPDSSHEYRHRLNDIKGQLKAEWDEGEIVIPLLSREKQHLVFKTRKNWNELGRLVKCPSIGFYIVIVPSDWKRDSHLAGPAPVKPENTHINNYKAHFFYLDDRETANIGFITKKDELIQVISGSQRFRLKGKVIEDASENMGPIFAEKPPVLCAAKSDWTDVGLIVVGKEGLGRRKWRTHFVPNRNEKEQSFPRDLEKRNGGWFFVRIYDSDENLLESLDFRFMKALHSIEVSPYKNFPGDGGHKPVELTFYHEQDCVVQLGMGSESEVKISRESHKTEIEIPNHPSWDVSDWKIKYGKAKIDIEIMIERIWWSLVDDITKKESIMKAPFSDQPLNVSNELFLPTSKKAFCIWLPKPRWANEVFVSLDESSKRKYPIRMTDRNVNIPIPDFYDEVKDSKHEVEIKACIIRNDGFQDLATICLIEPEICTEEEPVEKEETEEEVESIQILISSRNKACCGTCDHARKQYNPSEKYNNYWCRRIHWRRIHWHEYEKNYAHYRCDEWRGEYYDLDGKYKTS